MTRVLWAVLVTSTMLGCSPSPGSAGNHDAGPSSVPKPALTSVHCAAAMRSLFALDPQQLWIGAGSGQVQRTANAGLSWKSTQATSSPGWDINTVFFVDSTTGFAATNGWNTELILKSTDSGATWQEVYSQVAAQVGFSKLFFTSATVGFAASKGIGGGIHRTEDGGATWAQVYQHAASYRDMRIDDILSTPDGTLWAGGGSEGKALLLKSTDAGKTWQSVSGFHQEWAEIIDLTLPSAGELLVLGGRSTYTFTARTADSGATWSSPVMTPGPIGKVEFAQLKGIGLGAGELLVTDDGGASWTAHPYSKAVDDVESGDFADVTLALSGAGFVATSSCLYSFQL